MDRVEIEAKIKEIVTLHLCTPECKINNHDRLKKDLGADSVDVVEIILSIEDEFGLNIDDDEKIKTLQELIDCVCDKKLVTS